MSSQTSSVNTNSIEMPQLNILNIKKLDSSRSQPNSKKSNHSIHSKMTSKSALSQRSCKDLKIQDMGASPLINNHLTPNNYERHQKGVIKISQGNLSERSGSTCSIMIMQSLGSYNRVPSKQKFKRINSQGSSNSKGSSSSELA